MSNITAVIARIVVSDLDAAITFYRALAEAEHVQRFSFAGVDLASVGPFLLLAGPNAERFSDRTATLVVADLEQVLRHLNDAGGAVLEGPTPGPNGDRLIAKSPDGAIFEYIEAPAHSDTG